MVAADRAIRVLAQLQFAEAQAPGVEQKQPIDHDIGRAENDLNRLVRLDRADDARQHSEHSAFGTGRHQSGWRRLRIKAAIARATLGPEDTGLALETKDRAVNVGF